MSLVKVISKDGHQIEIEVEVALMCNTLKHHQVQGYYQYMRFHAYFLFIKQVLQIHFASLMLGVSHSSKRALA